MQKTVTFDELCELLPIGVCWGDNLTPDILREVVMRVESRVCEATMELTGALKQLSYEVEYVGGKLKPEFNELIAKHGGNRNEPD